MILTLEELKEQFVKVFNVSVGGIEQNDAGKIVLHFSQQVCSSAELQQIQHALITRGLKVSAHVPLNSLTATITLNNSISEIYQVLKIPINTEFLKKFIDKQLSIHCKITLREDGTLELITAVDRNEVMRHFYVLKENLLNLKIYCKNPKLSGTSLLITDSLTHLQQELQSSPQFNLQPSAT